MSGSDSDLGSGPGSESGTGSGGNCGDGSSISGYGSIAGCVSIVDCVGSSNSRVFEASHLVVENLREDLEEDSNSITASLRYAPEADPEAILIIMQQKKALNVYEWACASLVNILRTRSSYCDMLLEKLDVCVTYAVFEALRSYYPESSFLVESGSKVLYEIITRNKNKNNITASEELIGEIFAMMSRYVQKKELMKNCFDLLSVLEVDLGMSITIHHGIFTGAVKKYLDCVEIIRSIASATENLKLFSGTVEKVLCELYNKIIDRYYEDFSITMPILRQIEGEVDACTINILVETGILNSIMKIVSIDINHQDGTPDDSHICVCCVIICNMFDHYRVTFMEEKLNALNAELNALNAVSILRSVRKKTLLLNVEAVDRVLENLCDYSDIVELVKSKDSVSLLNKLEAVRDAVNNAKDSVGSRLLVSTHFTMFNIG